LEPSPPAYLLLVNETSAVILNFCSGFSAMLATVATVTLAADYCPRRTEGFSFAVMMSLINLATAWATSSDRTCSIICSIKS
jgi:hypothetical protein